jgi:hypothetical protein
MYLILSSHLPEEARSAGLSFDNKLQCIHNKWLPQLGTKTPFPKHLQPEINPRCSFEWDVDIPVKSMKAAKIGGKHLDVIHDDNTEFRSGPVFYDEWNRYLGTLREALTANNIDDGTFGAPEALNFGFHTHLCVGTAFLSQQHAHNFLVSMWNIAPTLLEYSRKGGFNRFCEPLTDGQIEKLNEVMHKRATDGRSIKNFIFSLEEIVWDKYVAVNLQHSFFRPQGTVELRMAQSPRSTFEAGTWIDFYIAVLKKAAMEQSWLTIDPIASSPSSLYRIIDHYCSHDPVLRARVADLFRYRLPLKEVRKDYFETGEMIFSAAPVPASLADELIWAVRCDDSERLQCLLDSDEALDVAKTTIVDGLSLLHYAGVLGNCDVFQSLWGIYHDEVLQSPDARKHMPEDLVDGIEKDLLKACHIFDAQTLSQAHEKITSSIGSITAPKVLNLLSEPVREEVARGGSLPASRETELEMQIAAVRSISSEKVLADIATNGPDKHLRLAALEKITNQKAIIAIARHDHDSEVRQSAVRKIENQATIINIAKTDQDVAVSQSATDSITDKKLLANIARKHRDPEIRKIAAERIDDEAVLISIAYHDQHATVRQSAIKNIVNQQALVHVINHDSDQDVRLGALRNIKDQHVIVDFIKSDADPQFCEKAVSYVDDQQALMNIAQDHSDSSFSAPKLSD